MFYESFFSMTKSISIEIQAYPLSEMFKSIVRDMFIYFTLSTY